MRPKIRVKDLIFLIFHRLGNDWHAEMQNTDLYVEQLINHVNSKNPNLCGTTTQTICLYYT